VQLQLDRADQCIYLFVSLLLTQNIAVLVVGMLAGGSLLILGEESVKQEVKATQLSQELLGHCVILDPSLEEHQE
jgi:hypothetical protein